LFSYKKKNSWLLGMFTPCSKMLLEKIRFIFFQTSNKFPTSVEPEGALTLRLLTLANDQLVAQTLLMHLLKPSTCFEQ